VVESTVDPVTTTGVIVTHCSLTQAGDPCTLGVGSLHSGYRPLLQYSVCPVHGITTSKRYSTTPQSLHVQEISVLALCCIRRCIVCRLSRQPGCGTATHIHSPGRHAVRQPANRAACTLCCESQLRWCMICHMLTLPVQVQLTWEACPGCS